VLKGIRPQNLVQGSLDEGELEEYQNITNHVILAKKWISFRHWKGEKEGREWAAGSPPKDRRENNRGGGKFIKRKLKMPRWIKAQIESSPWTIADDSARGPNCLGKKKKTIIGIHV